MASTGRPFMMRSQVAKFQTVVEEIGLTWNTNGVFFYIQRFAVWFESIVHALKKMVAPNYCETVLF